MKTMDPNGGIGEPEGTGRNTVRASLSDTVIANHLVRCYSQEWGFTFCACFNSCEALGQVGLACLEVVYKISFASWDFFLSY